MKTGFFCLTVLLVSLAASAQTTRSLYLETGPSAYVPLQHREHIVNNPAGGYYGADYTLTYKTMAGIHLNIGFEQRVAGNQRWLLSLPFALGYRNQIEKIERKGSYYGDFNAFSGVEYMEYNTQLAGLSVGVKLNYSLRKTTCFVAALLHNELAFQQTQYYHAVPDNGLSDYHSVDRNPGSPDDFRINVSIQAGFMYQFHPHWSVGLSLDGYLYNLSQDFNKGSHYRGIFNLSNVGTASGVVFNPAIRIARQF